MARSYRHTPIGAWSTSVSEKQDKRIANRAFRRIAKTLMVYDFEEALLPIVNEVSDAWCMAKDGKGWFGNMKDDPYWEEYYKKAMRK